jgi:FixJ family two-component response regulator
LDGFLVRVYRQGADLLADEDLANVCCVVMDDCIPLMGGFQIIEKMKLLKIQVPVILLTGHATVELRRRAAQAGVSCVLEKPLMENTLLDAILAIPAT